MCFKTTEFMSMSVFSCSCCVDVKTLYSAHVDESVKRSGASL